MPGAREPVETRLVIGPNASMSGRQALGFFAGLCVVCLGIAGWFAWLGFWPILPFAGLEMAALGIALAVVLNRNRYREVLVFEPARVRVERGRLGERILSRLEWPRGMTRVLLEHGPNTFSPTRLRLACGGEQLEIGRCLTDVERARLAVRLKELIHPAWSAAGTAGVPPHKLDNGD